jgi:uncharacterized membrane protein YkvA (DUF1232 family)
MIKKSKPVRPWMFKKECLILYFALKDKRTGLLPKFITLAAFLYLISPIDIIPDFIPVVGYLDDLVIVPLLINMAIRLLPDSVREDSILIADRHSKKIIRIMILIVLLTACIIAGTIWYFGSRHQIRL